MRVGVRVSVGVRDDINAEGFQYLKFQQHKRIFILKHEVNLVLTSILTHPAVTFT